MSTASASPPSDDPSPLPAGWRTTISVLLVIHLGCVLLSLSSNIGGSLLQSRLRQRLQPYLRGLGLELDYYPFHWTHASPDDVDHRLEVLPEGETQWQLVARGWRGSERHRRYRRLARVVNFHASDEALGAATAELARGVAEFYAAQRDQPLQRLRSRRHLLVDWREMQMLQAGETIDIESAGFYDLAYDAFVIMDSDGQAVVNPVDEAGLTARPVGTTPEEQP